MQVRWGRRSALHAPRPGQPAKEEVDNIFGQVDVDGSHALDLEEAKALVGRACNSRGMLRLHVNCVSTCHVKAS